MTRVLDDNETCCTEFDVESSLDFDAAPASPPLHSDKEFAVLAVRKRHENPSWFRHPEVCYRDGLQRLPARVSTSSARRRVRKKDDVRTKSDAIGVLIAEFIRWRAEFSIVSDDVLFAQLSHVSLPRNCLKGF
jgi:hypothetical protein